MRGQTYAEVDELWIEAAQAFFYSSLLPLQRSQCTRFLIRLLTFFRCFGSVIRAHCLWSIFFFTNKYRPLLTSNFIVFVHADTISIHEPIHCVCRRLQQTIRVRRIFEMEKGILATENYWAMLTSSLRNTKE